MDPLVPIPTPPSLRWREFRIQALPVITFLAVLICVVVLWNGYVMPTNVVGEVESVRAVVISDLPGTIKEIKVRRFQRVSAGEELAVISTMSPESLQAALRQVDADLKLMRARMQIDVERNQLSYQQTRLDYLKERVDVAIARVNAQLYEAEVARERALLTNNPALTTETIYYYWVRLAAEARTNVVEREKYLAEKEQILPKLAPATPADDAVLEAIKAQEEALRATAQPFVLKSPIDGMVSTLDRFPGEKIVPNVPIMTISAVTATKIVGYMRKPFGVIPKPGDTVQIRRQSPKREFAQGTITDVSAQLEPISPTLVPPAAGTKIAEMGLPFAVSIPAELVLIPGEPVDLILNSR